MALDTKPATDFSAVELTDAFNRCYEAYVFPVNLSVSQVSTMFRMDGVDLESSRLLIIEGRIDGISLIARRGKKSRLAAFAIAVASRRKGIGRELMQRTLDDARCRGDESMVLEVIAQNTSAFELYKAVGFQVLYNLVGYTVESPPGTDSIELRSTSFLDVTEGMIRSDLVDMPWQMSAELVAQLAYPMTAWRLGTATAAATDVSRPMVGLRGMSGEDRDLEALLRALFARYPGKTWKVMAAYPEHLHESVFKKLGFTQDTMTQHLMEIRL